METRELEMDHRELGMVLGGLTVVATCTCDVYMDTAGKKVWETCMVMGRHGRYHMAHTG